MKSNLTGTNPSIVDACPPGKQAPTQRVPRNLYGPGDQNPKAILSEAQVLAIYAAKNEPVKDLAKRYGVNRNTISMIRNGRRWTWLTQGDAA